MRLPVLVQAGGQGRRMQRSTGFRDKPLVAVRGVPLLERNVLWLHSHGFDEVTVCVPAGAMRLVAFVERLSEQVRSIGVHLQLQREETPQDTMGAAGAFHGRADRLLVVNADNLTNLNVRELVRFHAERESDLTLATHLVTWTFPYGVVEVAGECVTAYREKPASLHRTASAVTVLGERALAKVAARSACSLPELVDDLLRDRARVLASEHQAAWVDVNDASAVQLAEEMVACDPLTFECFRERPDVSVVGFVIAGERGLLLERRPKSTALHAGLVDTPGGKIEEGEDPLEAAAREFGEELGMERTFDRIDAIFDQIEPVSGHVVRHHVFRVDEVHADVLERAARGIDLHWVALEEVRKLERLSPVVLRSLSALSPRLS